MLQKYGVEHVSQNKESMDKIRNTNREKGNRPIVNEIKNIRNKLNRTEIARLGLKLSQGWYQYTDEKLSEILQHHLFVISESFEPRKSKTI